MLYLYTFAHQTNSPHPHPEEAASILPMLGFVLLASLIAIGSGYLLAKKKAKNE